MIFNKYGFVADTTKSAHHNAAIIISKMQSWYYFSRPTNQSCHNLCTKIQPPTNFRALLGLGLKYIPKPRYTSATHTVQFTDRFRRDIYTKIFMAHNVNVIPRLYNRSNWMPPINMVHYNLQERVNNFTNQIHKLFSRKQTRSNMLPHQRRILADFRTTKSHIVFNADKNLGPCVIERDQYIRRALQDHLLDDNTYKQLTMAQAIQKIEDLKNKLNNFIDYYKNKLTPSDIKYLRETLEVKDPYAKFYITAKVHKTPWKTRPIVSVCGSILDGLGRLVDKILQPYFKSIPSALKNSVTLKDMLMDLNKLPPNARLFTADAVSMYTNIDTNHAMSVIPQFLNTQPTHATIHEKNAAIEGLDLIMKNNIFQFGNTYWVQLNGTAMGVSPSCVYATIYYAVHEQTFIHKYEELHFYKRYIDDVIGIWIPKTNNDDNRWKQFQNEMNKFGKLKWEFNTRSLTINFLDLQIIINETGNIRTKIYEKIENLYLYLPASSSHPFGSLKGLIHGMVYRTIRLTSQREDQANELQQLVRRLRARGYNQTFLINIINATYHRISKELNEKETTTIDIDKDVNIPCFLHLYYHPNDPKSSVIQQLFQDEMYHPKKMWKKLPDLLNHRKVRLGVNKLIIAYHRTPNLGNLLSPRVLKREDGPPVSSYI
jgi:hypothetical protein